VDSRPSNFGLEESQSLVVIEVHMW
jgi:hypothetical protein